MHLPLSSHSCAEGIDTNFPTGSIPSEFSPATAFNSSSGLNAISPGGDEDLLIRACWRETSCSACLRVKIDGATSAELGDENPSLRASTQHRAKGRCSWCPIVCVSSTVLFLFIRNTFILKILKCVIPRTCLGGGLIKRQSSTCVPNTHAIPLLAIGTCPLSTERWEMRARGTGCGISSVTAVSTVVSFFVALAIVFLVWFTMWTWRKCCRPGGRLHGIFRNGRWKRSCKFGWPRAHERSWEWIWRRSKATDGTTSDERREAINEETGLLSSE
ncbi:hypothetical protein L228DRAFT_13473 [Xylona heveae TC161]|uniref:Uncharacterized protein n=1 Tax=Xylona heveae (strain CBS 132557 / TC161) TaxID=1328760 RepID=A0A165JPP3_XYLHT|nr:hypothetical protein L228DRAFT_13473 [Xylona heveae TC161]KZF26490.1 hypothetical protein L228DRAFT_13473 [Xylona heveae TC161]